MVEATVAQPIEAQVIGVDKMIYMKSNSGNDGSYGLTVSFELGTNPDINTVNVNNRVQAATPKLPPEVQRSGVTVQKRSSAILAFLQFYSEGGKQDPLFISNYVTINVLDTLSRTPGVGQAFLFGKLDYSMRIWFDTNRLISLKLAPSDIITAIQQQNVQAPVGPHRRAADARRPAVPAQRADPGTPGHARAVRRHRAARQPGRLGAARQGRGAGRARRRQHGHRKPLERQSRGLDRRLSRAGRERGADLGPRAAGTRHSSASGSRQACTPGSSRTAAASSPTRSTRCIKTLGEAFVLVVIVVFLFLGNLRATIIPTVAVPVSLIGTFAVLLALGFLRQHGLPARAGARHRHRRR